MKAIKFSCWRWFFCTIGTTIKNAGSKEAFRKVDFGYPQQFFALKNDVKQFLIISSLGADKAAGNFYLKTKGEIEDYLNNLVLQVFLLWDLHYF
jgi:uncharacterized protein YbjT (DUF2867 family)